MCLHTTDKTPDTQLRGRAISGLRKTGGWMKQDRNGGQDRKNKQSQTGQDLPLYKGLKWMSGPSTPHGLLPVSFWHQCAAANLQIVRSIFHIKHQQSWPLLSALHQSVYWSWECKRNPNIKKIWSAWHNSASFMVWLTAAQLCLKRLFIYPHSVLISLFTSSLLVSFAFSLQSLLTDLHCCPPLMVSQDFYPSIAFNKMLLLHCCFIDCEDMNVESLGVLCTVTH